VISENIATNHIAKKHSLAYIFVPNGMGLTLTTVTQVAPNGTESGEIMQNNGHYTVRGHTRSPILVPMESPYATASV